MTIIEYNGKGKELDFGITYYQATGSKDVAFGRDEYIPQHEFDGSGRSFDKILVSNNTPDGGYAFCFEGDSLQIAVSGKKLLFTMSEEAHDRTNLKEGFIFINGKDIFHETMKKIKENIADCKAYRKKRFDKAVKSAYEKGYSKEDIEEILDNAEKGSAFRIIENLRKKPKTGFSFAEILSSEQIERLKVNQN